MTKLFISGFPLDITELELVQLINPHGTVSTIKIVRDKKTRKCKGYAFVEMVSVTDAERTCAALNDTPMDDRMLTVKITEPAPPTTTNPAATKPMFRATNPPPLFKKKRPRRQG